MGRFPRFRLAAWFAPASMLAALACAESPEPVVAERTIVERAFVDRNLTALSRITGFAIRRDVAVQMLTRPEVNRYLKDKIDEAVKPAEIRAEELILKKFGFVSPGFDLKKTTIDLLTEQTAAFYDYRRKQLFLTDWSGASLRRSAILHELAHALADQNFSLERYARKGERDSEKAAARQAVVEGQATVLMRQFHTEPVQPGSAPEPDAPSAVFDDAPLYLRETLTFPYNHGSDFQEAVNRRYGISGYRKVFEDPPVSTQQILHPELYFAHAHPEKLSCPKLYGMARLVDGPLGELEHAILLRQFTTADDAREVSPHWRGARFQIWEADGRTALTYHASWESELWAQRYFALYKRVLQAKVKPVEVFEDSPRRFEGRSGEGFFVAQLAGRSVRSIEGAATRDQLLSVGR